LKLAGIHVWVLTGDKVKTAENIGKTSGLIDQNTDYKTMELNNHEGAIDMIKGVLEER